jgi:hypothetical protein
MTPFTPFRRSWITFQQNLQNLPNLQNTSALLQFPSKISPQSPLTDPFLVTIRQQTIEQSVNKNENNILREINQSGLAIKFCPFEYPAVTDQSNDLTIGSHQVSCDSKNAVRPHTEITVLSFRFEGHGFSQQSFRGAFDTGQYKPQ